MLFKFYILAIIIDDQLLIVFILFIVSVEYSFCSLIFFLWKPYNNFVQDFLKNSQKNSINLKHKSYEIL